MKRSGIVCAQPLALAAAVLVVLAPAHAFAPVGQYATFRATDDSIHDVKTGLRWQRAVSAQVRFYSDAEEDCAALVLHDARGAEVRGFRLPTYKELLTLVDEEPSLVFDGLTNQPRFIDMNAFPGTPDALFWTSTPTRKSDELFTVRFRDGTAFGLLRQAGASVRCVRSELP